MTRALHCLSALLIVVGCSATLPYPPVARHPLAAYREVPYPPPAALAETVPDAPPSKDAVWIDGEWVFHGSVYVWRRGGWVIAPAGLRFAPWSSYYRRDGRLMLASGTWYDGKYERTRRPPKLVPAYTPPNEITSERQTGR